MPSTATDRIDGISTSEAVKVSCRLIALGNITLSGLQTVDGVTCAAGDRILVANQTNAVDNGIYLAATTAWTREPDFDGARDATTGTLVFVFAGTTKAATWWAVTTIMPFVIAQDPVNFQQTTLAFIAVQATESIAGIAEIATEAETDAGTDDQRIVTPLKLAKKDPQSVTSTGSANAYVVTYSPAPAQLITGHVYPWVTNFANTGAATLNINGLGAKPIKTLLGADPPSAYIASGQPVLVLYDGTNMLLVSGQQSGLIGTVTFTSSGTYTKNPAARYVDVEIVGGGASGGGTPTTSTGQSAAASGGGGGAYARKSFQNSALGATTTVTVGPGGVAPTAGANNGNPGNSSSFSTMTANGGNAGNAGSVTSGSGSNSSPVSGGTATGGDINAPGKGSQSGLVFAGLSALGGQGGDSFYGAGATGTASAAGNAGLGFGGGGSGSSAIASLAARAGGAGASGIAIIREYA